MNRVRNRRLVPPELDAEQLRLYDSIVNGPRAGQPDTAPLVDRSGGLEGPFNAFLLRPRLGQAVQAVGTTLRFDAGLTDRSREIAILVVAAHQHSAFEAYVHEPVARSLELTSEHLDGIRSGHYGALPKEEQLVAKATAEMLERGTICNATFGALRDSIGTDQIFELTVIVGYYTMLALQLSVFDVPLPDGAATPTTSPRGRGTRTTAPASTS